MQGDNGGSPAFRQVRRGFPTNVSSFQTGGPGLQGRVLTAFGLGIFLPGHDLIFLLGKQKCLLQVECEAGRSAAVPVMKVVFLDTAAGHGLSWRKF